MRFTKILLLALHICLITYSAQADDIIPAPEADPHYTKVGFFDIHVCSWPQRKLFFMALFSTYKYEEVEKIEIYTPDNNMLGEIGKDKFRIVQKKGKPEKRVFIRQIEIPEKYGNGWYRSIITMKDGQKYEAKDYVIIASMGKPEAIQPAANAFINEIPKKLSWKPVPGAKNYLVFIIDSWEQRTIYTSKMLDKPELIVPKGILQKGGIYTWRIHARDVNENALLGDFNHGSLNEPIEFTIE